MINKIIKIPNNDDAGILTMAMLKETPGFPKEADYERGLIAVIECDQDIPCNPCEDVCPYSGRLKSVHLSPIFPVLMLLSVQAV